MDEFRISFSRNKRNRKNNIQWVDVKIWDVHPTTFSNWDGGRWGYFEYADDLNPREGLLGELHLVKSGIREDTIAHELFHVMCKWMFANWEILTPKNEESYAEFLDELTRKFWKGYRK